MSDEVGGRYLIGILFIGVEPVMSDRDIPTSSDRRHTDRDVIPSSAVEFPATNRYFRMEDCKMILSKSAILITALLFDGMTLYSLGFASFLFKSLPEEAAGPLLRRAFPHFYVFVILCSLASAALVASLDTISAILLSLIAATALLARQILMPAINAASDAADRVRFGVLHTGSVLVTLAHIVGSAAVIVRLS